MALKIPEIIPEKGFYYHYKHDSKKGMRDYAYELVNIGYHTESDCKPGENVFAVYRPLYESAAVYKAGKTFDIRPLHMFMDKNFDKDGEIIPERFKRITDKAVIAELEKAREEMYGSV